MKASLFYSFLSALFFLTTVTAQSQGDSLLVYDIASNTKSILNPVLITSTATAEHTPFSYGTKAGLDNLPTALAQTNLFPNSTFSKPAPASPLFNLQNFPARTAVKIVTYYNGFSGTLSGMLVGKNMVFTAATIIFNANVTPIKNFEFDSILVFAGYDNGSLPQGVPVARVEKMYLKKQYAYGSSLDGTALLQLDQPLGALLGFTGIGFAQDTTGLQNKVFHKFSYQIGTDLSDSTRSYNGDTMYYNYGKIILSASFYGIQGCYGNFGQGGSSILHFDGADYYNTAALAFSGNCLHYSISKAMYFNLKAILTAAEATLGSAEEKENSKVPRVFPNPASDGITIDQLNTATQQADIFLYDSSGKLLVHESCITDSYYIPRANIEAGLYIVSIKQKSSTTLHFKVLFQ